MGSTSVTVGTTPTIIAFPNMYRKSLSVFNNGAVTVYLDYSNSLSEGAGFPLKPNASAVFNLQLDGEAMLGYLFGVASASCDVRVLEG